MKKLTALILALMLCFAAFSGSAPARADGVSFFSWNGFSIELLSYDLLKPSANSSPLLHVFVRLVNQTNQDISAYLWDATMGGAPVTAGSIATVPANSSTSTEDPESIFVTVATSDREASSNGILTGNVLRGTLVLYAPDAGGTICKQSVVIDLTEVKGTRDVETPRPTRTPTPRPTATPKPTQKANSPAYSPASRDYKTLKEKDRGQAVKDLQQRLTDLGYLNYKVNGVFNTQTTIAFRDFCSQNGLRITNEVSPDAQTFLYSTQAKHYQEQWIPLVIGPQYKWDKPGRGSTADLGYLYPQVVNRGSRDIRGYEFITYTTDVWGNYLGVSGDTWVPVSKPVKISRSHTSTVKGGYYQYDSIGIPIAGYSLVYSVWVGIHKIVFTDGEVREINESDIVYFEFPVK